MEKISIKKLRADSPDFEEADMSCCLGTPQECWDLFWGMAPVVAAFTKGEYDFFKPIDRSVVRKTYIKTGADV